MSEEEIAKLTRKMEELRQTVEIQAGYIREIANSQMELRRTLDRLVARFYPDLARIARPQLDLETELQRTQSQLTEIMSALRNNNDEMSRG